METALDVITIGRSSVDLYGAEIGTRLEDVALFRKSVGGCPTNVAIGAARLGLRSAIFTRIGDEQMGHFIRAELEREGVATAGVRIDKDRLSALVLLAVQDGSSYPHIFYRENCADMALNEDDIDPDLVRKARCVVATGTHFSTSTVAAASWKAIHLARQAGAKVVFDIDFRPSLWGLVPHAHGEARLALSQKVRDVLLDVCAASDVIVGTEEEFCSALNETHLTSALKAVRGLTSAVIVCKKGADGCAIFPGRADGALPEPIRGDRFEVDIVNTIGAGDAFLSGFLRAWLGGEDWQTTASWANACGAIAVSRLMCSIEYPTWPELAAFVDSARTGSTKDLTSQITAIHRATTRWPTPSEMFVLAVDHRTQFEEIADRLGADRSKLSKFKQIAVRAAEHVAKSGANVGIICDAQYGADALFGATRAGLWTARPIEVAGSKPLAFVTGPDVGSTLLTWPAGQTVKCLCHFDLDDADSLRQRQEEQLIRLDAACKTTGRELLLEIIPSGMRHGQRVSSIIRHLYGVGIRPDWWKLEPFTSVETWREIGKVVSSGDPHCRGILILGLKSTPAELAESFKAAASSPLVRGFAVGRAVLGDTVEPWLADRLSDKVAQANLISRFESLIESWRVLHRRAEANTPSSQDTAVGEGV